MKKKFKLKEEIEKEVDENKVLLQVKDKLEKQRTRLISIKEGASASVMTGVTADYITPFALTLKASNYQIGLLSSFIGLIPPLSQLLGSKLMEKYSRKRIITMFVFIQALMWLPIALLALLFWKDLIVNYLPWLLILFYTLYGVFGAIAGPAWFSLMGDIVPEKIRGKYFGKRNKICGSIALISALLASLFLDLFKTHGFILLAFAILFSLATIFRLISARYFKKHYDPEFKLDKNYYFSIFQFVKRARQNNFGRFVIALALFYFSATIAGPFFAVYMLKSLNFSFTTYMLVNLSATVLSLLFMPIWGKFSDKYGNKRTLQIGSVFVSLMPLLWIISPNPIYLILFPQLISGIGWAAFNLGASNFIYDSVTTQRRALCVSYYNILVGIGVFLGSNTGGLLAQYLSISWISKFLVIFFISGILRLVISFFMISKIKEIREVKKEKGFLVYFRKIAPFSSLWSEVHGDTKVIEKDLKKVKTSLKI